MAEPSTPTHRQTPLSGFAEHPKTARPGIPTREPTNFRSLGYVTVSYDITA
jgi:hypothetical protein